MITGILIPMDEDKPLQKVEFETTDPTAIRGHVGGLIELINLDRPDCSLWCHGEAKLDELKMNRRGTLLLWMHATHYRSLDFVAGDVLITGREDANGDSQSVPDELLKLLFDTTAYRIEVQTAESGEWNSNEMWFSDWVSAYNYGLNLAEKWLAVLHVRVVSA